MTYYLVIAYDTPSDKRRNKLVKLLKNYGERRQYSLFELRVSKDQLAKLKQGILKVVDEAEDTLAIYFLSPETLKRTFRIGHAELKSLEEPDFV
ncbi:MAG: CRISPR-associated endonuclease Cas2 [Trueperaceae bacterium]|nr:CRISPR-associated endonuclease Cas2 [Trueperaceae bacterium]